ncbi:MAG: hypothetical protein ACRCXN_11680 [Bacteroidales bacterium]
MKKRDHIEFNDGSTIKNCETLNVEEVLELLTKAYENTSSPDEIVFYPFGSEHYKNLISKEDETESSHTI